jgi:hypothetical protein
VRRGLDCVYVYSTDKNAVNTFVAFPDGAVPVHFKGQLRPPRVVCFLMLWNSLRFAGGIAVFLPRLALKNSAPAVGPELTVWFAVQRKFSRSVIFSIY